MSTLAAAATLRLRKASPAELPAWDETVRRFENHRVVHTMAWIRSLEASGFGHPQFLVFEKGGDIVGCLPGSLTDVGPFQVLRGRVAQWSPMNFRALKPVPTLTDGLRSGGHPAR